MASQITMLCTAFIFLASAATTVHGWNGYNCTVQMYPNFKVNWVIDKKNTTINFTISANTTGWVGLGIKKQDKISMQYADIVISGVYNGKPYLTDFYGAADAKYPSVDLTQNVKIHKATEKNGYTNVTFSRGILSKDKQQDVNITMQLMTVIAAYGDKDYNGNTPDPLQHPYHQKNVKKRFGTHLFFYSSCGKEGGGEVILEPQLLEEDHGQQNQFLDSAFGPVVKPTIVMGGQLQRKPSA